jgi:hypothetical protein
LWLEMKQRFVTTPLKVQRWWWGARRSHDVVQRAGGRLLWLGDTGAGSKTWTMPATMLTKKVMYRQFIHSVPL